MSLLGGPIAGTFRARMNAQKALCCEEKVNATPTSPQLHVCIFGRNDAREFCRERSLPLLIRSIRLSR